uniref:Uncharacterized protein n=1 Tax=Kalanchoe fedtschenkoi TaxID=63787 RepID=A0A7N0RAQ8_KALFE
MSSRMITLTQVMATNNNSQTAPSSQGSNAAAAASAAAPRFTVTQDHASPRHSAQDQQGMSSICVSLSQFVQLGILDKFQHRLDDFIHILKNESLDQRILIYYLFNFE